MTIHEDGARYLLDRWSSQPSGAEAIVQYTAKLGRDGWYDPAYVDAIGQPHFRDWPLHQVAAFAWAHGAIGTGKVAQIDIGLGRQPRRDQAREENAAALRDLPAPFIADVDLTQYGGDQDGTLRWTEPVVADLVLSAEANGEYRMGTIEIPVGGVPLEIGSTYASRTAMHLAEDGGVARWAYGHDRIRVFIWVAMPLHVELGAELKAGVDLYSAFAASAAEQTGLF